MFQIKQDWPHIGKIIKSLREYRRLSQDALAQAVYINRSTLSQIELGKQDCPNDMLLAIKNALEVEELPLRDSERPAFRDMLYKWYGAISERSWDAAKEQSTKLSVIKLLPYDTELNSLFSLFECRLLLGLNELELAKQILDVFKDSLDELSDIQRYHYYYNQGTYNIRYKQHQAALDFYLKSYELVKCGLEKSVALYYNISICYENLGFVSLAIAFLEEACTLNSAGQNNVLRFHLYNSLGINYACTGHLQRARALLDKAYEIAVSDLSDIACDDAKTYTGMVLINYGYLFRMAKKWNIAIENLNRAMIYIPKDNAYYLEALYQKIRCLILMGNSLACADLLNEGASLSKGDEIYVAMFEALRILISPNDETARYLETKILASLLENNVVYPALDYAMFLRDYYGAKIRGFKIRALEMSNIACNILNRMHEGGVIE